jgi:ParB family chromosome partitioning protein
VANALRLLKLPAEVRAMVGDGRLSEGHGRALLGLNDAGAIEELARKAVAEGWSVREVEARVRGNRENGRAGSRSPAPPAASRPTTTRRVEEALRKRLGTDVRVAVGRRGRGHVTLSFYSNDDLARLLELILGEPFSG